MKANLGPFAAADEDLVAGALPLGAAGALLLGADDEDLLAAALPLGAAGALAAADLVGLLAGVVLVAAPDAAADVALLAGAGLAADVALLDDPPAMAAAEAAVLAGAGALLLSGG